jgi:hypothetical protein
MQNVTKRANIGTIGDTAGLRISVLFLVFGHSSIAGIGFCDNIL